MNGKKFVSILLAIVMVLSVVPMSALAAEELPRPAQTWEPR